VKLFRTIWLAWIVLAVSLGATWLSWKFERHTADVELRSHFDYALRENINRLEQRIAACEQLLHGVQALIASSGQTDRNSLQRYLSTMERDTNFSGIQVIGVIDWVPATQLNTHLTTMRRLRLGDYAIQPQGERESYAPVVQQLPDIGMDNSVPLGFDAWTNPALRSALEQARDSGLPAISGKVQFSIGSGAKTQPGFVMYLPLFAHGQPTSNLLQRRTHLIGWVFASFPMNDLMASLYGQLAPGLSFRIFDGIDLSNENQLFQSVPPAGSPAVALTTNEYLVVGNHTWTFSLQATTDFASKFGRTELPRMVAWGGGSLSLLLALITWLLSIRRSQALQLAKQTGEDNAELIQSVARERAAREEQQRNAKATVVAMANFAEQRDVYTGVHVLRVARMVGQVTRKLKMQSKYAALIDDEFIECVTTASILHDVGKIATPDAILLKPGPLTEEEREQMQRHTVIGADLLKQARLSIGQNSYIEFGIEIALSHHERYDGRGYPNRLAGDAIPLAGRICAVVDVFDALISRRPYKIPWSTEKAVALIREQRGTQFDPDVVDTFLEVIAEQERICLFRWTEAMSVGDLYIDEQHAILIDIINQLASADSLNNHHTLSMVIDELVSYTTYHFDYEERLMQRIGFPHLEEHQIVHQAFVRWVMELRETIIRQEQGSLGEAVLNYLTDWLQHHILGEDQRYRSFIADAATSESALEH
jgi:hemerythrin-like metal-binding protein